MRTVKIRLRQAELSREMMAMRVWLDNSRYETRRFDCLQNRDAVVVAIDFVIDAEGDAFAARFCTGPPSAPGHPASATK
jgi:hypothetical protein